MGVTRDVMQMNAKGMSPRAIRIAIDTTYADLIEKATPTPYPPS
jgi:hypothetical protein